MRLRLLLVVSGLLFPSLCNAADSSPRELLTALNALAIDSQHVYTVATKDRVELRKADTVLAFQEGKIAFFQSFEGRITGFVFSGVGHVVALPRNPVEKQVLEYAQANCVHCHNGVREPREPGQRYADLDLTPGALVRSTVNQQTMSTGTAPGPRVLPGDPMRSILLQALRAVDDPTISTEVKPMPLVGGIIGGELALELLDQHTHLIGG